MTDTRSELALVETELRRIPPSGDVREDFPEPKPVLRGGLGWPRLVGSAGAVIAFASAVTSVPHAPPAHELRLETSSVICFPIAPRGRPISLTEARKLALAAMAQAEQRRATFAEREAKVLTILEEEA